MSSSK